MKSSLNDIKSKFILKLITNYIPYIRLLKIVKHSKIILNRLDITEEYFKAVSAIKRVIDPSYEIEKYYDYFKINVKNETKTNSKKKINVNEWTLYRCLNSTDFNIKLNIIDKNFEKVINNANKINLIINSDSINYLESLDDEAKENVYNLLNKNKKHIVELSVCELNHLSINYVFFHKSIGYNWLFYLLERIFQESKTNNELNNKHCIKRFNYLDNNLEKEDDVIFKKINNIIPLNNTSLNIDFTNLSSQEIDEIKQFIYQNSSTIKYFEFRRKVDIKEKDNEDEILSLRINTFFAFSSNNIEILDLSNYPLHPTIFNILNNDFKMLQLKDIKLTIYVQPKDIYGDKNYFNNWNFMLKIVNTLEVFELKIQNVEQLFNLNKNANKNDFYYDYYQRFYLSNLKPEEKKFPLEICFYIGDYGNLISSVNQMKKLRKLNLNFILNGEELINFKNFENIEYLNVTLDTLPECLKDYFINFKKIKALSIYNKCKDSNNEKKFQLIIPPALESLELRNFDLNVINSILNSNKTNLNSIKNLLVDYKTETIKDFRQLILYYLLYFKSLKKLSIYGIVEKDCSPIFKVVPSLIELNIRMLECAQTNEHKYNRFYSYIEESNKFLYFDNFKSAMTKNIIQYEYQLFDSINNK